MARRRLVSLEIWARHYGAPLDEREIARHYTLTSDDLEIVGRRRGDADAFYRVRGETVVPVDTTGAGDAFSGALAARLAAAPQAPFADAVRFANRYAALSTTRAGAALAMPRLAELAR